MAVLDINLKPDPKLLRQFGFIAFGGFGLLALAAWTERAMFASGLGSAREAVALALLGVGAVSALFSAVAPRANLPLYLLLTLVTYPIGFVLSYVIMGVLFFGVFAPMGLVMRLVGRDPLGRRAPAAKGSYWQDCRPTRPMSHYFKQF